MPICVGLFLALFVLFVQGIVAQSGANTTGNGGKHIIQGRIYADSGRRPSIMGLKVVLKSASSSDLTTFVDGNATFAFKNLQPGSYTVVIDGGDQFEDVREPAYIDAPGGSASISGMPRISTTPTVVPVQVFLEPKKAETLRNEILNAKWSAIPKNAIQHFKRGFDLREAGKDTEAETEFRTAIGIAPNFAPAYTGIGTLQLKARQFENAVESFKQAIRYDATDFDACLNLGIAYFNLNKMAEAEPALINAAYLDRFAVKPHYYLGLIFSARNDGDVAQKAFEKVNELDGGRSFPVIHKYLGRIYMHKQMNKQAISEFETYLSILPNAKDADIVRKDIAEIKGRQNTSN